MKIKIETAAMILTAALITPTGYLLAGPRAPTAAEEARAAIPDATLVDHVRHALIAGADVKRAEVAVRADSGAVHLSGWVRDDEEMARLEDLASRVEGVREVRSHLRVRAS